MIKDKEGGTCRLFFFQFFNLSTGRLGGVFYPCSPFSSYNPPLTRGVRRGLLIYKAFGDVAIVFYSAVSQERPPTAHILAVVEVEFYNKAFFLAVRSTVI